MSLRQGTTIIRRKADQPSHEILQRVSEMLETVHFGSVTLVIQDGHTVQIDKKNKVRLNTSNGH